MTTEYKLDVRHQIKSFRENFVILAWSMLAVVIEPFVARESDPWMMIVICLLFWIIIPVGFTIPFHINYLLANWRTKLFVDDESKTIRIIQARKTYDYKFSDIKVTRYVIGHHRPGVEKSWTPIPFDYYGYLQVNTNDKKEAYLTSLMLDPFNPPLPVDNTEYRFPIIKRP